MILRSSFSVKTLDYFSTALVASDLIMCSNRNVFFSVSHCSLAKATTSNNLMHKINRDSVSVMLSLNVADVEPCSKRARLVERQASNTVS